ncbi:hypothetical protein ON010_g2723 [Phytophthora cinnamomi]|nr:hypothetical protein ON010_g2723 [Phytophthora cinnamomi]
MTSQIPPPDWALDYYHQQMQNRKIRPSTNWCRPSVIAACLAVVGRAIVGPLALLLLVVGTGYLSDATVLIKADDSFFSFTEKDLSMAGGCTGCIGPCNITLLKLSLFSDKALVSAPTFGALVGQPPTESLYDFSLLSSDVLALGDVLDGDGSICHSGINEWGSTTVMATSTPQQILKIISALNISVGLQTQRELELAVERENDCKATWTIFGTARLFLYPTGAGKGEFGKIPAATFSVFPEFTECRPYVALNFTNSKEALTTGGENLLAAVPDVLTLFPYGFTSNMHEVSRIVPATNTKYEATTVVEPQLQAYYGGCRVRAVNTTGIFIEDTCEISKHWATYGLMVQSPDDIPLCSTKDVCIHNYFNTQWEGIVEVDPENSNRVALYLNTFRSRYGDSVGINVLPAIVVAQILLMGVIWAYRCQNGRMQIVYLAQITYHFYYNSDLYMLGLATGTLTGESIANLTFCFFAFSYSFVNMVKARSGDQQLDRHYRLIWEAMQLGVTISVGSILLSVQRTPFVSILTKNAEILRKTSARGAKYCGLNDSCILFTYNMPSVVVILSVGLGIVTVVASYIAKLLSPKVHGALHSAHHSPDGSSGTKSASKIQAAAPEISAKKKKVYEDNSATLDELTSFERNCIGAPFSKLFHDCDDIAYVSYNGKKCITPEALLLTGYLYHGERGYAITTQNAATDPSEEDSGPNRSAVPMLKYILSLLLVVSEVGMVAGVRILTTNCSNRCGRFAPCVVRAVDGDADEYSCLHGYTDVEKATFLLNGGYGAESGLAKHQNVGTIGVMELGPATTHMYAMLFSMKPQLRVFTDCCYSTFAGGSNSDDVERGNVSSAELSPDFAINSAQVTDVAMVGLNLTTAIDRLPSILPARTAQLRLENDLLTEFPTLALLRYQSLSHLNLDSNWIETVHTSAYSNTLMSLYMKGNPTLSRDFTRSQADFLRNLTWDLKEEDFGGLRGCNSDLQQIHGVFVCITDATDRSGSRSPLMRAAVERRLYDYADYSCPGYYSGGVLAGCIIGTVVVMLLVGAVLWRWQKQKQTQSRPTSLADKSTKVTSDSYASVWQDPQLLAIQLKAEEIEDVRKIGGGAYADVWLVKYRSTQLLASKRLRKVFETLQNTQNFLEEIKMVAKFDHPNIVKLIGAAWTMESDLQALSEYMVGGDVREFLIYPHTPRTWTAKKLEIATDVIEALVYLHSFIPPVVHRDLKSRNILLSREMRAKLTDFGVSRIMSEENTMTQGVGTSRWEAPEVLAGKENYNQAADIFSFGVVLSELDTHAIPYEDARGPNDNPLANVAILQMIAMGAIRPAFSTHCPPDIRALANRCLEHDPDDRPSAPEVAYALRSMVIS